MGYNNNYFYNQEQKQKFIDYKLETISVQSVSNYGRLFASLKEDEERYGMDFCDFNYDTLINVLSLKLSCGINSKSTQKSLLDEYVGWCISQHLKKNNDNPIASIKASDIDSSVQIRKQFIRDPEHLESVLNEVVVDKKDDSTLGIMYRMCCWLLYYGFIAEEVIELSESDVDFDNNAISYNGKTIAIADKLKGLIKQAIETEYTIRNTNGVMVQFELEDTDRLFKKIKMKNTKHNSSAIRIRLAYFRKAYQKSTYESVSLSPNRLWLSGMFYRLHQREENNELTKNDFNYNTIRCKTPEGVKIKITRNQQDYENWKKAFELL